MHSVRAVTSVNPFKTATMPAIELVPVTTSGTLHNGTAAFASDLEVVERRPGPIR